MFTLDECLRKMIEEEKLTLDDGFRCNKCKEPTPHIMEIHPQILPPILVIHLKRFKFESNQRYKINKLVDFPIYDLDMSKYKKFESCLDKKNDKYDLYAVVNHFGTMNMGHYTCHIKSDEKLLWNFYNDNVVQEV